MNSSLIAKHLELIAQTPETNRKKTLLASTAFRPYLEAAYNPYKMYHMKEFYPTSFEHQHFSPTTWRILDKLQKRHLTGKAAIDIVHDHIQYLTPESQNLFKKICRKDLKCGVSTKLINAVHPGLVPTFYLMKPVDWKPGLVKLPCYVSPKLDGMRGAWREDVMRSTKGKELRGFTAMSNEIRKAYPGVELDGELTIPDRTFEQLSGDLRSHKEKPTAQFWVFDIPSQNKPFEDRYNILQKYYSFIPNVFIIPHTLVHTYDQVVEYYEKCLAKGLEGIVIKSPNHLYQAGKSPDWIRLKLDSTYDVQVVGMVAGRPGSKYADTLGALVCEFNGKRFQLSGMSDAKRKKYWNDPESIVGSYVEVKCKGVTTKGSLREPVFERERKDK